MQAEQLLYWSGMTDTEHTTSGSNEEDRGGIIPAPLTIRVVGRNGVATSPRGLTIETELTCYLGAVIRTDFLNEDIQTPIPCAPGFICVDILASLSPGNPLGSGE